MRKFLLVAALAFAGTARADASQYLTGVWQVNEFVQKWSHTATTFTIDGVNYQDHKVWQLKVAGNQVGFDSQNAVTGQVQHWIMTFDSPTSAYGTFDVMPMPEKHLNGFHANVTATRVQ